MTYDVIGHSLGRDGHVRLWVLVTTERTMSDVSESLLDVDKIKELSLLIGACDVNESRGLVDPLFELVGVTMHVLYSSCFHMPNLSCTVGCVLLHDCMVVVIVQQIKKKCTFYMAPSCFAAQFS